MRSRLTFLSFVLLTTVSWGVYGPLLHVGQAEMGEGGQLGAWRPFVCVGVAYLLIAVIYPAFILLTQGESGNWSLGGMFWSSMAGSIGAVGVLAILFAFRYGGDPLYVMPLVFGCAPVANTIVTMLFARTIRNASLFFYLSILIVLIGAAGIIAFKPAEARPPVADDKTAQLTAVSWPVQDQDTAPVRQAAAAQESAGPAASNERGAEAVDGGIEPGSQPDQGVRRAGQAVSFLLVFLCVALAAVCWGAYGAILHRGQTQMGGSRLRPFLCVGLAYFLIAVILPLFLLPYAGEPGGWSRIGGLLWSLLAGVAAAVGALSIIYAFHIDGGQPRLVMPLVFGLAPVINTLTETLHQGLYSEISSAFWISLGLVIFGAVLVLVCAPASRPPSRDGKPPAQPVESTAVEPLTGP